MTVPDYDPPGVIDQVRLALPNQSRTLGLIAVLCTLALAACASQPGDVKAARGMEIALQDDPVFVGRSYFDREKGFAHARSLGVTRLRVNANWAFALTRAQQKTQKKPAGLTYQFNTIDSIVDAAARHGIRVHVSLTGPAPAWAAGNRRLGGFRPNQREFSAFVTAAATHLKGRVDRYSIWNEPNWRTWLSPMSSAAAQYRGLYSRGYAAIKKADPRAKVLIGETAPSARRGFSVGPVAFLRALACVNKSYKRVRKCTKLKADGYAHHPYDFAHSPRFKYPGADNATMGTLTHLTRALDRISRTGQLRSNGGGKLGIYLTEFGYFASGHRALSASTRSRYLADGFNLALRNGRVKSQLQYLLVRPPKRYPWSFFDLGLISVSGKKQPQYGSLQRWYKAHRSKVKRPGGAIGLPPPSGSP
jgi:hypothetical protein